MRIALLFSIIFFCIRANAQDLIYFKMGDTVACKIHSTDKENIYFSVDSLNRKKAPLWLVLKYEYNSKYKPTIKADTLQYKVVETDLSKSSIIDVKPDAELSEWELIELAGINQKKSFAYSVMASALIPAVIYFAVKGNEGLSIAVASASIILQSVAMFDYYRVGGYLERAGRSARK